MAELIILLIKIIIVLFALVTSAAAFILSIPYALFWPTPVGMTWGHAVRDRVWRVMKFVRHMAEVALTAIDTPA